MKIKDLVSLLDCHVLTPSIYNEQRDINYAFCADLMSDALMILNTIKTDGILENSVLITGLTTNQSIRTAEMLDVEVILIVRGKMPASKVIFLAEQSGVCLIQTNQTMFNTAGLLYQKGIKGIIRHE